VVPALRKILHMGQGRGAIGGEAMEVARVGSGQDILPGASFTGAHRGHAYIFNTIARAAIMVCFALLSVVAMLMGRETQWAGELPLKPP